MKKFITALVAVALFGSGVTFANTTDAIKQYKETTPDTVAVKPVPKDEQIEKAKEEFIKLTEEVTENARTVRFMGSNWAIAHTEHQRLLLLKQKAEAKSKSYEEKIQKIVEEQNALTMRSIELASMLRDQMDPEAFDKLRMEFIVPKAIELETMKQASINFVQSIEAAHQKVANNPDMLTVENHIALTKYDKQQLDKFLKLSGNTITE